MRVHLASISAAHLTQKILQCAFNPGLGEGEGAGWRSNAGGKLLLLPANLPAAAAAHPPSSLSAGEHGGMGLGYRTVVRVSELTDHGWSELVIRLEEAEGGAQLLPWRDLFSGLLQQGGMGELPHTSVPHAEEPKDELQLRRVKGENDKGRRDLRRRPRVEDNCKADLSHRERVASVSASSSTEEADVDAEVELQFSSDKALVLLLWRCGEPGEERLDVGNTGVWKGLLEHTQQQAVGQGKGQRKVEAWAPRQGHPGEKRKIYSAEAQLEVIVYVRPPQGKTTLKINKETGGLERQTALEDSSAGQEQDNK
ncbi:hypothetical protein INR49_024059 [Caranx melampygus]|nr:hypothetical protein INR49_024059 [Caranx melampygus]